MNNSKKMFALVDCNSFYCSCERIFRPDLEYKPVIVLSNNDGCAIARTSEAKQLGIAMGAPYFKIKNLCEKNDVAVFSANFSLYTNISDRIMNTLSYYAPRVQVYSVDEAFLDLSGITELKKHGIKIKKMIKKNIGIPVGVGIAPTKVLAKLANHIAKKSKKANGVVYLETKKLQDIALERTKIEDVWGIGRRSAEKLKALGLNTAKDFRDFKNEKLIQSLLTKVGLQIKHELMGIRCFDLEFDIEKKKEIMCSRSFGAEVYDIKSLKESIANYVSDAAEKLRKQNSFCTQISVFARTSQFSHNPQYFMYQNHKFKSPTNSTIKLIRKALELVTIGYKSGYKYKKAGIKLMNFYNNQEYQIDFLSPPDTEKELALMSTIDKINMISGFQAVKSLACGTNSSSWQMKREFKSPKYTTDWRELKKFY